MNARIIKLKEEYGKNESKIVSLQSKNKKLAEKITQLENADIVGAVRERGLSIDELLSLLAKTDVQGKSNMNNHQEQNMEGNYNEV